MSNHRMILLVGVTKDRGKYGSHACRYMQQPKLIALGIVKNDVHEIVVL